MEQVIERVIRAFETGRISRRQMVASLAALSLGATAARAEEAAGFKSTGLNHIALRVTDVARSRDFYIKHLGMAIAHDSSPDNCFLIFGNAFAALFKGDAPAMDHVCFAVDNYNVADAEKKLKALGLDPEQPKGTNRIYFKDPDGLKLQLSGSDHTP